MLTPGFDPTPRSVRRRLKALDKRDRAKLVEYGFGPLPALEHIAAEDEGAVLVDSVLALHTRMGGRPPRPEDEANAAEARRRARRFGNDVAKGRVALFERPRMGLPMVLVTWAVLWGIAVVFVPGGMFVTTLTAEWVTVLVVMGVFFLTVFTCAVFAGRGHFQAWLAILPILLVLFGVVSATSPLYLKEKGRDVQGEFVRAWTTAKGKRSEQRHCLVAFDDAGTRRAVKVDGCPDRFFTMEFPARGEHVPVAFVLSPGPVASHVGRKADLSVTWQASVAGTGLALLAALTAWGVTGAVRARRRDAAQVGSGHGITDQ
ncbi:hypothetical protein [Actinomadura harenae]|uniref:DUF3592 domain-containing protein n=1 Tax=Actinomadura harenae TaxID=2483351 RepID=A0A3M2LN62_9ACTN|nr:hypothetical protein [Actinomadura harenae]RMI38877.1 hypothetical protein EBO15_31370 [Actinomadura harenae]